MTTESWKNLIFRVGKEYTKSLALKQLDYLFKQLRGFINYMSRILHKHQSYIHIYSPVLVNYCEITEMHARLLLLWAPNPAHILCTLLYNTNTP